MRHTLMESATRTVLAGGTVVTVDQEDQVFDPGAVAFAAGKITYVGPSAEYRPGANDTLIDARNTLVMPGLINAHTHSQMSYDRGIAEDVGSREWFRLVERLGDDRSLDDLYWAALLGCCEMIRNGTTCIVDPGFVPNSTEKAIYRSGLRAIIAPSISDLRPGATVPDAVRIVEDFGVSPTNRISCGLGSIGPDTSSTELLQQIRRAADKLGAKVFIHVAQSEHELQAVKARGFDGSVNYLHKLGFLGPDVIATHCIYVSMAETSLLATTGTKVIHCPTSNAKIEAKIAPIYRMLKLGIPVGLGTDCVASNNTMDMWEEMKWSALLGKISTGDPTSFRRRDIVRMATIQNAKVLELDHLIGSLEVGKSADIVVVDKSGIHLQPWNDLYSQIVYCIDGSDVMTVFVEGQPLLLGGEIVTVDENEVKARAAAIPRRDYGVR